MDKNVSLKIIKQNFFKKIFSLIGRIFNKKVDSLNECKTKIDNNNNTMTSNNKEDFVNSLRIQEEKNEIEELQNLFENNKISLKKMSNRQLYDLNSLYEKQIMGLKTEIKIEKNKLDQLIENNE